MISFSPEKIDKSSTQIFETIEPSVWIRDGVDPDISVTDKLNPILPEIKINILCMNFQEMPICIFFKLVNLLPNLNSLEMSDCSSLQFNNFSTEYIQFFYCSLS